jgi:hypothetical protein
MALRKLDVSSYKGNSARSNWFTVVRVGPEAVQRLLNSLIFVCNLFEKRSAHITIRGPSCRKEKLQKLEWVRGQVISFKGIGTFFEVGQNTVFIECDLRSLNSLWLKPQWPRPRPHLTLYDGVDGSFASELYNRVRRFPFSFDVQVECLDALKQSRGQGGLELRMETDLLAIGGLTGKSYDSLLSDGLTYGERLDLCDSLCNELNGLYGKADSGKASQVSTSSPQHAIQRQTGSCSLL